MSLSFCLPGTGQVVVSFQGQFGGFSSTSDARAGIRLVIDGVIVGSATAIGNDHGTGLQTFGFNAFGSVPAGEHTAQVLWHTFPGGATSCVEERSLIVMSPFDGCPTPVELGAFDATSHDGLVTLIWETSLEENNAGFHVSRAEKGANRFMRITGSMIESTPDRSRYEFVDRAATPDVTYVYQLESIGRSGTVTILRQQEITVARTLPREIALHQNRPNPFNPSTTIPFELPWAGHVTLRIYDVNGRPVRSLVDAQYAPGYHDVEWDGRNDDGRFAGSGVYTYQLQAGERTDSGKLVLTK